MIFHIMFKVAYIVNNMPNTIFTSNRMLSAACSLEGPYPYSMSSRGLFFNGGGVGMDMADMSQNPSGVFFGAHC